MSSFELESMVGSFMGSLEFHWGAKGKSPRVIANKIDLLAEGIDDTTLPMVASRQILMDDIDHRFETETDLDGFPWAKHNPDYDKWLSSKGYPGTILRLGAPEKSRGRQLIEWLHEPTTFPIVGHNLAVNTANAPPYWRIHDRGGYLKTAFTTAKGTSSRPRIPKRSYLGLSETAAFAVVAVFDDWIGRELDIIMGPVTGVAMARERPHGLGRIQGRIGLDYEPRIQAMTFPG